MTSSRPSAPLPKLTRHPWSNAVPRFEIKQYQTHVATLFVDAPTAADAIQALYAGNIPTQDIVTEFLEVNEDIGMPDDENITLTKSLIAKGGRIDSHIPSIAGITKIKKPRAKKSHD